MSYRPQSGLLFFIPIKTSDNRWRQKGSISEGDEKGGRGGVNEPNRLPSTMPKCNAWNYHQLSSVTTKFCIWNLIPIFTRCQNLFTFFQFLSNKWQEVSNKREQRKPNIPLLCWWELEIKNFGDDSVVLLEDDHRLQQTRLHRNQRQELNSSAWIDGVRGTRNPEHWRKHNLSASTRTIPNQHPPLDTTPTQTSKNFYQTSD